nr:MAG TPA: Prohead core protein serine protease [Caudoviricetes sp.]
MYDLESPNFSVEESINETTGLPTKKYKIKGIFSTIGEKNRNGRIYPKHLWERNVKEYQEVIETGSINRLGEWQHPPRSNIDPMKGVIAIDKLYIDQTGKYVMGEATLLDNEQARQLKSLIDNGIKLSVSSRSLGSVKNGIVEDFKLITYDVVDTPSDYNATMNGLVESYQLNEGILMDKEFDIVDDKIVEVNSGKSSKKSTKKSIKEDDTKDTEDKETKDEVEILNDDETDDTDNTDDTKKTEKDKEDEDKDDKNDKDEKSELSEQDLNRFNQELKNKFKELLSSF